jgi:hypothetical protein
MKKINVLLIAVLSSIFFSCGNKEGNNVTNDAVALKEVAKDCGCNELVLTDKDKDGNVFFLFKNITKKGSKELFTGNCVEIDQNDSVVKKLNIKNGWVIKNVIKEKVGNIYITMEDMNYENEEPSNGWNRKFPSIYNKDEKYICKYVEYKNGRMLNYWEVYIFDTPIQISARIFVKDGKDYENRAQPKWMPGSEYDLDWGWTLTDISPKRKNEIINGLKGELPKFATWKI